jgi:hypothetical protein
MECIPRHVTQIELQSLSHTDNQRDKGEEVMSHVIRVLVSNRECICSLICDAHLCHRKERGSTDEGGGSVVQISASVHSEACLIFNPRVIRSKFEGVETRKPRYACFWDDV